MQCHELRAQLLRWSANADEQAPFTLVIDDGDVTLSKLDDALLLAVELPHPVTSEAPLEDLLRLAHPSLARFPGALARSPHDARLWLMAQPAPDGHLDDLIELLEALLNQRDTWQSILHKTPRVAAAPVARRPSHAHFLGTGIRHA
ncbi:MULTISPECIES: type III secretion system chaperone [Pseudomonas]|uniref:type III secretion system chaperone n=1 Tax=Pseudomonas TaxID=286 RepID=UPI001BEB5CA5|nr:MULTISPECIES: type III secretion system chaperone [Pseudomonas]MBT2340240.1 type III secretion system chaperone [Pseudomonas fluorescens]MCD4530248.1 type III secretion system chaperone [Pseudomonas sp. C3-2018]